MARKKQIIYKTQPGYFAKDDEGADEIKSEILYLLKNQNNLSKQDWIVVTKILQQLNDPKHNYSKKVLRGMKSRIENITHKYQR